MKALLAKYEATDKTFFVKKLKSEINSIEYLIWIAAKNGIDQEWRWRITYQSEVQLSNQSTVHTASFKLKFNEQKKLTFNYK